MCLGYASVHRTSLCLERDQSMSGADMNTSDISGNDSSDGSGSFSPLVVHSRHAFLLADSPTHMGDEQSSDEPFMLRSVEGK